MYSPRRGNVGMGGFLASSPPHYADGGVEQEEVASGLTREPVTVLPMGNGNFGSDAVPHGYNEPQAIEESPMSSPLLERLQSEEFVDSLGFILPPAPLRQQLRATKDVQGLIAALDTGEVSEEMLRDFSSSL